ncbi:hypothetical protein BDZ94DRAFT_824818 [Collybia nuda]|uniref:J domain-containing protein n=1 Tax=Collybia nuda TaxID=64659 RepID=A0A9P5Y2X0_9AGAR|nr:hypothetical protein BDZ94DRAFT_824818 [Collybia nuda]
MLITRYGYKLRWVDPKTLAGQVLRRASTTPKSTNPFPFPSTPHPTPHQIFHLPINASEGDIKARYFDLVRIYHPDKANPSIPPEDAHATFQSITAAYDSLRGKTPPGLSLFSATPQDLRPRTTAEWRAMRMKREALYAGSDERWKDKVILAGLLVTVAILVGQIFITKRQALAEAMAQSKHTKPLREGSEMSQANFDTTRLEARDSET